MLWVCLCMSGNATKCLFVCLCDDRYFRMEYPMLKDLHWNNQQTYCLASCRNAVSLINRKLFESMFNLKICIWCILNDSEIIKFCWLSLSNEIHSWRYSGFWEGFLPKMRSVLSAEHFGRGGSEMNEINWAYSKNWLITDSLIFPMQTNNSIG